MIEHYSFYSELKHIKISTFHLVNLAILLCSIQIGYGQNELGMVKPVLIVHILKLYKVIKTFSCHNGFDSWGINQ